jgi:hypothetical protein
MSVFAAKFNCVFFPGIEKKQKQKVPLDRDRQLTDNQSEDNPTTDHSVDRG